MLEAAEICNENNLEGAEKCTVHLKHLYGTKFNSSPNNKVRIDLRSLNTKDFKVVLIFVIRVC